MSMVIHDMRNPIMAIIGENEQIIDNFNWNQVQLDN